MTSIDLSRTILTYSPLFNRIGAWWHHLDSTRIVKSDSTAAQIRDWLKPHIDASDELVVLRLTGEGAWVGINEQGSKWLMDNL
jgi:hypothetical protein